MKTVGTGPSDYFVGIASPNIQHLLVRLQGYTLLQGKKINVFLF